MCNVMNQRFSTQNSNEPQHSYRAYLYIENATHINIHNFWLKTNQLETDD